jgi:hypothetical protein
MKPTIRGWRSMGRSTMVADFSWFMVDIEEEDTPCPYCGEDGCERSCTGAILADEEEDEG